MTIPSHLRRVGWRGAAALLALLGTAGGASAASYTVLNNGSTGPDSLRGVLALAAADSDASDTITFDPGVTGTIALGGTELAIGKSMTITGPGANVLTLDAGGSSRIFNITAGTITISGLTLGNGHSNSHGGAVVNAGTLTISDCVLSGSSGQYGGGISNETNGVVTLKGDAFTSNSADYSGGGFFNASGNSASSVTNCTFAGNTATYGGGLLNAAVLTVKNCTFSGNTGSTANAGGIYNLATATVTASLFTGSTGGDIHGSVTSGGSNLLGDADGHGITGGTNHDQTGVSAATVNLGPLASNGGPTQTCALLAGSPAIDADYSSSSTLDQRGFARPAGARNDIGAFEYGASAPVTLTSIAVTAASASVAPGGTDQFTATATYSDSSTADVTSSAVWSSDTTSVATINTTGLATGVAQGTAGVTATLNGIASTLVTLTVTHTPATLIVTNNLDDGSVGCLRTVLAGSGPGDTVTFASNVTGTIALNGMELAISQDVTIQGPGASVLAVDAGGSSRVFDITAGTVAISGLTLENGNASGGSGYGGGIYSQGTLTVTACAFNADGADSGGGLFNDGGTATITICTFSGSTANNYGGGLYNNGGTLTVTDSTFAGDTAMGSGGAISSNGTLTVTSSTFSANSAASGGGLDNESGGTATITASLFSGSVGGDIGANGGATTSGGSNLLGDPDGNGFVNGTSHDLTGISNTMLGPLASNSGPTQTCAVLAGSPAIGADYSGSTTTDQRGAARTAPQHTVGAFEYQPPSTHTHLLWTNADGAAAIWTINNADGSFTSTPGYGPFVGWTARTLADGTDGKTRLLWTRTDGQNAVWTVNNADGTYTSTPGYGPYDGGNWAVASLAVGPDNLARLQWQHSPDGQTSVWTVAGDGSFTSTPGFGPYADAYGPWTASALAVGGDGFSRLLWSDGAGRFSVWTLDALSNIASTPAFGPIPGWTVGTVAGGPDADARLLLSRTDGAMAVWTVNGAGDIASTPLYGPISGWTCHGLAVGPDALSHVLWSRTDGQSAVWTINSDGSIASTPGYGPYNGWSATALTAGP